MLKGCDLKCAPLKTVNKEGSYELREIHCKINDTLYYYNKKDMSDVRAMEAYNSLCKAGKELKELQVSDKALAKKQEILEALRGICKELKTYADNFKWEWQMLKDVNRVINYEVAMLSNAKKNGELLNSPWKYLEEIKEVRTTMIEPYKLNCTNPFSHPDEKPYERNLKEFNNEILGIIQKRYSW